MYGKAYIELRARCLPSVRCSHLAGSIDIHSSVGGIFESRMSHAHNTDTKRRSVCGTGRGALRDMGGMDIDSAGRSTMAAGASGSPSSTAGARRVEATPFAKVREGPRNVEEVAS